jgi:hypothetical protein
MSGEVNSIEDACFMIDKIKKLVTPKKSKIYNKKSQRKARPNK